MTDGRPTAGYGGGNMFSGAVHFCKFDNLQYSEKDYLQRFLVVGD
jgi:hypothetical protein